MKKLVEIIRCEIAEHGGVLPFARFMELALYCPKLGYYETKKDSVGRRGDFYTSVSTGDLFGSLLAFQFAQWLEGLDAAGSPLKIVEAGAHSGQLAKDILTLLQSNRPRLFAQIEYCIVEPSEARQEWQRETLAAFEEKVRWAAGFQDLDQTGCQSSRSTFQTTSRQFSLSQPTPRPRESRLVGTGRVRVPGKILNVAERAGVRENTSNPIAITGIIFSNELLDAFPARRLGWDATQRKWFEWGVAINGEHLTWAKMPKSDPLPVFDLPPALFDVLPDNFTTEINPAAESWWRLAAGSLVHGKLMTLDYGLIEDEFFQPSRKDGTLRAYAKHRFADDLLANPGEQDLTAHVNFSAIQKTGEEAGLKTDAFFTQEKFLAQILERTLKDQTFGEWTPARTRQFQTLTHPEHLGRAFRVLIQSRQKEKTT